jgi:transcriptional regulator with XRE-family HTH domain
VAFADNLKKHRERAGLSQSGLALAAGVPVDSLRRWEQGKNVPGIDIGLRLARALGVSLDYLAGDDGTERPKRKKGK